MGHLDMDYSKYMQMQYLDISSKTSSRPTFDGHGGSGGRQLFIKQKASPSTIVGVKLG